MRPLLTIFCFLALFIGCSSPTTVSTNEGELPPQGNLSSTPTPFASEHTDEATYLTMSVHVEGWVGEKRNPEKFDRHAQIVLNVAREAHQGGAIFSFELSTEFATSDGAKAVVDELLSLGHAVEVHADTGGIGTPTLEEFGNKLTAKFKQVQGLGVTPILVSGICSRGPFVEAAIAAGYKVTTGIVEYCFTSLDPMYHPEGWDIEACPSPSECHGDPDFPLVKNATPWKSSDSSSWLLPNEDGNLLIIVGESGATVKCLSEKVVKKTGCKYQVDDIEEYANLAETYVLLDEESVDSKCCVFSTTMSVGSPPPEGYVLSLVDSLSFLIDDGRAQWRSPRQIFQEMNGES